MAKAEAKAVSEPDKFEAPKGVKPTPPGVTTGFLLVQFWRDIFGKEVQSAATYSYLWMADQMGHVALLDLLYRDVVHENISHGDTFP